MKNRTFSIRFKLTSYTILCFFLFLCSISAIASGLYYTSVAQIIDEQIINTSKQVVSNYELYFDSAIEVSNSIQTKIDNRNVLNEKTAIRSYFDDVKSIKGEILSIAFYDENGDLIVADSTFDTVNNDNVYETNSFQNAINEPMINIFSGVGFETDRYAFTLSTHT